MENKEIIEKIIFAYMKQEFFGARTEMCKTFAEHGSDKSTWHNYTNFYDALFQNFGLKDKEVNFFELGLGTNNTSIKSNMGANGKPGASMRAFAEYFPKGKIFGADIDKDILFQTDRIKTFYCDQTDPEIIRDMWSKIPEEFDIIIDDGLHEAHANITFFANSFHKLKKGGIFIIEDILNFDVYPLEKFLSGVECDFKTLMHLPMPPNWAHDPSIINIYNPTIPKINIWDNNIAVIIK
jgi:SAM-dependent methyltransferase